MPAKKHQITDVDRAANIRKLAREVEASNDPAVLDGALRVRPITSRLIT